MEQKILDCTLRDGGLVNRFYFTDDFVRGLYRANLLAGIDYMEFGYKASEALLTEENSANGNSAVKRISGPSSGIIKLP